MPHEHPNFSVESKNLLKNIQRHIVSSLGNDFTPPRKDTYFYGLALSIRDRLIRRWLKTQSAFHEQKTKRLYYLSMEFLPGRFLLNYIRHLQMLQPCKQALKEAGLDLEEIEEEEWDAGLGNGGLGRLASCFLDSMATLGLPGYGYGIRYDYGIFYQEFINGSQVERCDNWMRNGSPWEIRRRGFLYEIKFYGRSEPYTDNNGERRYRWVDTDNIMAMACDFLISAYCSENVNNMRLWAALSSREFNLQEFNEGDYIGAVQAKVISENISKVLYPRDESFAGKELRLKQQYFLVAATLRDILRRFKKSKLDFSKLSDEVAIQLNDTHPCIGIAELMRILMDEEDIGWDPAWDICGKIFAYTNHTVLPEALETWPVDLMTSVLPRHMEIITEINRRFLEKIENKYPSDHDRISRMEIVHNGTVRMANLAIVGSHKVNGVSELHTRILKERLFSDFDENFPEKFINITNGISPRRWLIQANPDLTELISRTIGDGFQCDLTRLKDLIPFSCDGAFIKAWQHVKYQNKERLARYILRKTGMKVDPESLFDVQVKRIHEYKRQLLNVLHVITLYNRMKVKGADPLIPRTVIFAGKAAPGYAMAKLIIRLINSVANVINHDPDVCRHLKVVFLPNYCVSQAEKIIPAADLSQQISTAGMEASGTGNMKLSLNGALTIGTMDGANVEIMQEVGRENFFIFGLNAEEVAALHTSGYQPREVYEKDPELKSAIDMISSGAFSEGDSGLFVPVIDTLFNKNDYYMVLADFRAYVDAQGIVGRTYLQPDQWAKHAILNTANMGKFSSDRAVEEYARKIWGISPVEI